MALTSFISHILLLMTICNYLIFGPIQCFYLYKYWKQRRSSYIHPRRPNLNILCVASSIYFTTIHCSIFIYFEFHIPYHSESIVFTFYSAGFLFVTLLIAVRAFQVLFISKVLSKKYYKVVFFIFYV